MTLSLEILRSLIRFLEKIELKLTLMNSLPHSKERFRESIVEKNIREGTLEVSPDGRKKLHLTSEMLEGIVGNTKENGNGNT